MQLVLPKGKPHPPMGRSPGRNVAFLRKQAAFSRFWGLVENGREHAGQHGKAVPQHDKAVPFDFSGGLMKTGADLTLTVNGKERVVPAGTTLRVLVEEMGAEPSRVVVERNLEIVPEANLGAVEVADGDKVEVVQFVGGG